jgi:hypothetical protein
MKTKELAEAEDLLAEVAAWPEDEVETLPKFYRRKARQYRELADRLDIN